MADYLEEFLNTRAEYEMRTIFTVLKNYDASTQPLKVFDTIQKSQQCWTK